MSSLKEIAKRAGVSIACVSRVLSGDSTFKVREDTRLKILRHSEALGYHRNRRARDDSRARGNPVQIILLRKSSAAMAEFPGLMDDQQTGLFIRTVARELGLDGKNLDLPVRFIDVVEGREEETAARARELAGARGVIVYGGDYAPSFLRSLHQLVPTVVLDYYDAKVPIPCVVSPDRAASANAVRYLQSLGHRRIGCIYEQLQAPAANDRHLGYRDAMAEAGLSPSAGDVVCVPFDDAVLPAAADKMLHRPDRPTAIFCGHDMAAVATIRAARKRGLAVPAKLSVVGFSNCEQSQRALDVSGPFLTTVEVHFDLMIREAARLLSDLIRQQTNEIRRVVPASLLVRKSCAPPASGRKA